ncbi:MAG TPA: adenylosuccinate lyase [Gemmatimonadaceae bacterium]|nr:adenylosuccinate lyase [Gemmatimonadaceae bacterium]
MHDTYSSPLSARYASRAMLELWSPHERHLLWRQLWIALAESEMELGIDIPQSAIAEMRAAANDIDFDAAARYEERFRHDVMAHVHTFADAAPSARRFIHLGATSAFVTDNADLILMRRALTLLRGRAMDVVRALSTFADQWKDEPTLGYTHIQPAQLTTVGKRATLWIQDLVLDIRDIQYRIDSLPLRGVKGTTGTQASFLRLFNGDHAKVRELDRLVTSRMGFSSSIPVSGQTYTRKLDAGVLGAVAGLAASAAKFASDMRLLQSFGEMEEPFEKEQIGSSAMAYKRNPMRSERINSLARFVLSLESNANETHSVQYFERTLDDSANRRLVIPEMFLATDAIMLIMRNVASGIEVHPARIARRVADELPFMATEELIVRAVEAGGDRQAAHEVIRKHSVAAATAVKNGASRNDMLDRLAADPDYAVRIDDLQNVLDARNFIGRSSEQVTEFLREIVDPLLTEVPETSSTEALRV